MVLERDFVIVRPLANFYCMKLAKSRLVVHLPLPSGNDAYECLCILIISTKPSPVSALCSQIHRRLAVLVPFFFWQLWVHCPRVPEQFVT